MYILFYYYVLPDALNGFLRGTTFITKTCIILLLLLPDALNGFLRGVRNSPNSKLA